MIPRIGMMIALVLVGIGGTFHLASSHLGAADWSADGSRLVFWTDWDGNLEVYSVNTDGSDLRNLTRHPAEDANPVWSPDGTRIAFYSRRVGRGDIFVMDADGSNVTNLTRHPEPDHNPSWSPDGQRLVFQSYRDGHGQIYVMDADGSNQTRISRNEHSDTNPDWSPNGRHILFVSSRHGRRRVFVMDISGEDQRQVVTDGQADLLNPKWRSDGNRFVYHSLQTVNGSDRGAIFTAAADGSDVRALTDDVVYNFNPYFSPRGDSISYNVWSDARISIWIMAADGSNPRLIARRSHSATRD